MTASSNSGVRFAGEVEIKSIEIISHNKVKIDVTHMMIEMSLYEDIFSNTVYGTLLLTDSYDLIENTPFIGEELININVCTPSMENSGGDITYSGYIYKISDKVLVRDRNQTYVMHFVSYEKIIDINKKISRAFTGKISDQIKLICTEDSMLGSDKTLRIEETENSLNYACPYSSPLKIVNWLAARALSKEKSSASFLFYETLDRKLNFMSLDTLYKQNPIPNLTYRYDSYLRDTTPDGSTRNIGKQQEIIREYYIDEVFDYIKRAKSGVYASRLITSNPISKTIKVTSTDYLQDFGKTNHLGEFPITTDTAIRRKNSLLMHTINQDYTYNGQKNLRFEDWMLQRTSLIGQANNVFKLDMVVTGRTDIRAGMCVNIELNQSQPVNSGDTKDQMINNYYSGKFLITCIHHKFEARKHMMVIQAITDSLRKKL